MSYTFAGGAMGDTGGPRLARRSLLRAGAAGALVLGGSLVALARTAGYAPPAGHALRVLRAWQFAVVEHAARRITAPDRSADRSIPTADELGVAAFVDDWLTRLPQALRRDLGRFLGYLEHLAPLGLGYLHRFSRLAEDRQDRVLDALESSSSDLLRAGFDGLRSLVFLGYYRDPRTWPAIGYDGPLVGRPAGGWAR